MPTGDERSCDKVQTVPSIVLLLHDLPLIKIGYGPLFLVIALAVNQTLVGFVLRAGQTAYIWTEFAAILASVRRGWCQTMVRFAAEQICAHHNIKQRDHNDVTNAKPIIIVVIDDDPSILRALRRLLSGAGYEVWTFDRPSEVLKIDLPKAGACLIVDIDLPEMNGVELCATLSASGCKLPVILITAHTDDETRRLADGADPVALLIKPFGRELLVNSIQSALLAGQG